MPFTLINLNPMEKLSHDYLIDQLSSLRTQYSEPKELDIVLGKFIQEVEKLRDKAIQRKIQEMKQRRK